MNIEKLISYLEQFAMPDRIERINQVIEQRTNHVAIAVEETQCIMPRSGAFGRMLGCKYIFKTNMNLKPTPNLSWVSQMAYSPSFNTKSCIES